MTLTSRLMRGYHWSRRYAWCGPTIAEAIVHNYMLRTQDGESIDGPTYRDLEDLDRWTEELNCGE